MSGRSVKGHPPPATVRTSFSAATGPDEKTQGQRHFNERVILKNYFTQWGKKKKKTLCEFHGVSQDGSKQS